MIGPVAQSVDEYRTFYFSNSAFSLETLPGTAVPKSENLNLDKGALGENPEFRSKASERLSPLVFSSPPRFIVSFRSRDSIWASFDE